MYLRNLLAAATAAVIFTLSASAAVVPLTFTKEFDTGTNNTIAPTVPLNGSVFLRFTITNNDTTATASNINFTDNLPAGLQVASPLQTAGTCGAGIMVTATAGGNTVSLVNGGPLAPTPGPFNFCSLGVFVTGTTAGNQVNTTGAISSSFGTGTTATASILVVAPPIVNKSFGNPAVAPGQSTTVTFIIANPNTGSGLTGVTLVDNLPAGLTVSNNPNVSTTCSVVGITANPNATSITITGANLAARATCTVTVNVTGRGSGPQFNLTDRITSDNGGTGSAAGAGILVGDPFQVRYATNLTVPVTGDSVIDITNTGESSTNVTRGVQNGNICVNVYAFSPDEQLIECCSCLVTPNGLISLSAKNDLISNTLTPSTPSSIVIKLLASTGTPSNSGTTCNSASVGPFFLAADRLTTGLAAWGSTLHAMRPGADNPNFGVTETPFTVSTLSFAEISRITTLCGFNQTNGSTFGTCKGCRAGGLGAGRQQ